MRKEFLEWLQLTCSRGLVEGIEMAIVVVVDGNEPWWRAGEIICEDARTLGKQKLS